MFLSGGFIPRFLVLSTIILAIAVGRGFESETQVFFLRLGLAFVFGLVFLNPRHVLAIVTLLTSSLLIHSDGIAPFPIQLSDPNLVEFGVSIRFWSIFDQWSHEVVDWWRTRLSYATYIERAWSDAIVRGAIYRLNPEFVEWFRDCGLLHILVVSGFHFSVMLGFLRQSLLLPLRVLYSLNLLQSRSNQVLIFFVNFAAVMVAFLLLEFLLGTPPAQRAFCCFAVNCLLSLMPVSFDRFRRLELALTLHALLFPEGLISISGILSWMIYLSVFGCGRGIGRFFWLQFDISCIVGVIFGQINLTGVVVNFWAASLGTLMLATAIVPVWGGLADDLGIRYWNLFTVNHILSFVRWLAEIEDMLQVQMRYQIKSVIRWLLAVIWCARLMSKFSKPM